MTESTRTVYAAIHVDEHEQQCPKQQLLIRISRIHIVVVVVVICTDCSMTICQSVSLSVCLSVFINGLLKLTLSRIQ